MPNHLLIGERAECAVCLRTKSPRGRSVPMEMCNSRCDSECPGYNQEPYAGDLWPGERREDFGYPPQLVEVANQINAKDETIAELRDRITQLEAEARNAAALDPGYVTRLAYKAVWAMLSDADLRVSELEEQNAILNRMIDEMESDYESGDCDEHTGPDPLDYPGGI